MHTLAAYGDGSDDETSPKRRLSNEGINPLRGSHSQPSHRLSPVVSPDDRSSSQSRNRRDSDFLFDEEMPDAGEEEEREDDGDTEDGFREPAPPRRQHDSEDSDTPPEITTAGMSKVCSTASLSGLERDTFEKEDARLGDDAADEQSRDASQEPPPPVRQSMDDDDSEEIDRALEECARDGLMKMGPGIEGGSTPQYDSSPQEVEGPATPRPAEERREVVLPPAPDLPADPAVEEKFRVMFERKARGANINKSFQNDKSFLNPSIYELFIEKYEIKEFGSNFPLEQYDPDGFTPECYYDYISKRQNDGILRANAAAAKKAGEAPAAKKPKV